MKPLLQLRLNVANGIFDALRPIDQPGRVVQYAGFLREPHIAHLWLKDAEHSFTTRALFDDERHLHQFLGQWQSRQLIGLRNSRICSARAAGDGVQLVHEDAALGVHVFRAVLPSRPCQKTLLIGFADFCLNPDFCHTFGDQRRAQRFLECWLDRQPARHAEHSEQQMARAGCRSGSPGPTPGAFIGVSLCSTTP